MIMILTTLLSFAHLHEMIHINETTKDISSALLELEHPPEPDRAKSLSYDLYNASIENPIFHGPDGVKATALFLVAVGYIESKFIERLEVCKCKKHECDAGKSLGIFQIRPMHRRDYSKSEFCNDRRLQMKIALKIIKQNQKRCKSYSNIDDNIKMWAGSYNTGKCNVKNTHYTRRVYEEFDSMIKKHNIRLQYNDEKWISTKEVH